MTARTHLEFLVDDLIGRLRARKPIRTGSLVVTLFGDIVVVRGGSLWLGSVLEIMAGFGLSGGLVRTSMTRLVADGWLERHRRGRQSFYRFTPSGRARAVTAAARIYAGSQPEWTGGWHVVLMPGGPSEDREVLRKELGWHGFAGLGPSVMVAARGAASGVGRELDHLIDDSGAILIRGEGRGGRAALRRLARQGWDLGPIEAGYRAVVADFGPLREAIGGGASLDGVRALLVRLLMIHEYRRILLRDPGLPLDMLPSDWPGLEALEICRQVYRAAAPLAERWICDHCVNESGPLPAPDALFSERLGGRRD